MPRYASFTCPSRAGAEERVPQTSVARPRNGISTLNERSLHASLKEWYERPGDELEVDIDGFLIDIVRGGLLIEIQTGNFAAIRRKLVELTEDHPVRLVHPIPLEKWIVRLARDSDHELGRRRSPKRGRIEMLFEELVRIPALAAHPNFSIEVLLTREEELRRRDGTARAWRRRGWVIQERRLIEVVDRQLLEAPEELASLLPEDLDDPFSTAGLAELAHIPRALAQKMAYCLRAMGMIRQVGKCGNAILYQRECR